MNLLAFVLALWRCVGAVLGVVVALCSVRGRWSTVALVAQLLLYVGWFAMRWLDLRSMLTCTVYTILLTVCTGTGDLRTILALSIIC
jgi:hypothetical protein